MSRSQAIVTGIFQTDIILRSAVIRALTEVRNDPSIIDDAHASLLQDELTRETYGAKTIERCREWFLGINVPVKMGVNVQPADLPCIAVGVGQNQERETTLADLHEEVSEVDPDNAANRRRLGRRFEDQTITLGCFVSGDPEACLFLATILHYQLLRVIEPLLEARGFELSTIQTGPFGSAEWAGVEQPVYTRGFSVTGKVKQTWALKSQPRIEQVVTNLPAGTEVQSVETDIEKLMELDVLSGFQRS